MNDNETNKRIINSNMDNINNNIIKLKKGDFLLHPLYLHQYKITDDTKIKRTI